MKNKISKYKTNIIFLILYFTNSISVFPQYFETGQDPSSVKWRQINTTNFKLVYDSSYEFQAQRLAAIFEYCDTLSGKTLSQKPQKISIIIHNHSAIANGLVVWAPKRMEIYPVAPQDIYPQDWFGQLGLHEWRHVAQISRTRRGLTSFSNIVIGQQAQGLSIAFMHPWFLEGDAVVTETALSATGRGREPSFEMETRAFLLDSHKPFPFKKVIMDSFRDHIPNYYETGYLLVAYNRLKYGAKLWEDVLDYDSKNFFTLFPFYFSLKKSTGLSRSELYRKTFYELDSAWSSKANEIHYSNVSRINNRFNTDYISYRNPCIYNDSVIIAEKSGINDVTKIVSINCKNGNEKALFVSGNYSSDNLSLSGTYLVWSEVIPDIRWQNRSYSIIRKLDLKTGQSEYLSRKSEYFAPVISPDSKKIAVVETDIQGKNSVVLLSAENGKVIDKFGSPDNCSLQYPSWDNSSRLLVMTAVNQEGKELLLLDTKSGQWQTLLKPSFINISQPKFSGNYVIYRSGLSGIENLYAIHLFTKKIFQITSVQFGAFDPIVGANGQNIFFSNYTSHGFDIARISIDTSNWIPLEDVKKISLNLADKISLQEPDKFDPGKIQNKTYISKPYSKIGHLFYIHSWLPFYTDLSGFNTLQYYTTPGYMLFSQNLQGTVIAYGGQGFYNKQIYSNITLSYKALFPVFQVSASSGDRYNYFIRQTGYTVSNNNSKFIAASYVPLNFSRGKYTQSVIPMVECIYDNRLYISGMNNTVKTGLFRFGYYLNASRYYVMSKKDIFPEFGQLITVYFSHPPQNQRNVTGNYGYLNSDLYFPGIFKHNSIKISAGYEQQEIKNYFILSRFLPSRGFLNFSSFDTINFSKVIFTSFDYAFPLFYPDIQLLKFIFIKRLQGDLFLENVYSTNKNQLSTNYFTSSGFEMTADYNLFYIPVLINTGIRVAYRAKFDRWVSEFVLRVNLNSL